MAAQTWLGLWKQLDPQTKRQIALAGLEHDKLGKAMVAAIAQHDRVRRQSVERWPAERRAEHFAGIRKLPSTQLAAALLAHFHLTERKKLVTSFLDFVKIPHKDGVIENIEELSPPTRSYYVAAIRRMMASFPRKHVRLFLDVLSCQSNYEIFEDIDQARAEAIGERVGGPLPTAPPVPMVEAFVPEMEAEQPVTEREAAPVQDDTPPSFTTLDQMLIRSVVASVADVHGAMAPEKVEDLVEEIIQLNLDRHQSYFHRGFLTVLQGRPLELDFPEASDVRRGWYACGAIVGLKRKGALDAIVDLLTQRPDLYRELSRPGTGYAERVASIVFEAFCAKGRFAEAARFLSPAVVGRSGVPFGREVLETASGLIRERREADARRLLDVLLEALPSLKEDPDLPADFEVLLQRRRAHCARLRGDFEGARKLLTPQLALAEPSVRSDILADLGLIECGLRSLADVRLPPEEERLADFAAQFEPGWKLFEQSSKVSVSRGHGDFCLGIALFAKGQGTEAISHLERAVAGMSADPDRYGRFGPLDSARLALAVALAEQADMARVPYARDLLRQVFETKNRAPDYLLRRMLVAFEITDTEAAIELANEIYTQLGAKALDVLAETQMARYIPAALDELLAQAGRSELSDERRWDAAKVVLIESHAMRDAADPDASARFRERATEALDVMVELAGEDPFREELIELLSDERGPWRSAIEALDGRVLLSHLYESKGEFPNAAAELTRAFHAMLDADDEWALGKAEALLEDVRALGGDEAVAPLEPRYQQYKAVFERRSASGLVIPPSIDPEDLYGLILVVGGNETQEAQDQAIAAAIKRKWPNITVLFERTAWSSNWGEQLRLMEGQISRARAVVIMRYIRTMLGRALRKRCGDLDVPWVACTGSGRASMERAIEQAILLAWRQAGVAHAGQ